MRSIPVRTEAYGRVERRGSRAPSFQVRQVAFGTADVLRGLTSARNTYASEDRREFLLTSLLDCKAPPPRTGRMCSFWRARSRRSGLSQQCVCGKEERSVVCTLGSTLTRSVAFFALCSDSLAASLFGITALELATFQQATNLCMIYGMLLPCMVGLDVFWMATNEASKLVVAMGILGFVARVLSVPCWMSMWQQGFLFASGNFAPVLQPDGYGGPPGNKPSYPGGPSQNPSQGMGKAPVVGGYQSIT